MNRLLNYLPPYERESKVFKAITSTEEIELDKLDVSVQDVEKQFFVDTASWGLGVYEKELKLPIRPNKTLEERRAIIKAEWRGVGKVDAEMIKAIVKAFTNSNPDVAFDGKIRIIFSDENIINLVLNMRDMFRAIDEIKPSHLGYSFAFIIIIPNQETFDVRDTHRSGISFWGNITLRLDGTWALDGTYPLNGIYSQIGQFPGTSTNRLEVKNTEAFDVGLTIEKNLWFLNGTRNLDGETQLNAEIMKEVL